MSVRIVSAPDIDTDTGALPADTPLRDKAIYALRTVMDPELPLNIYDLGLIYAIAIDETAQSVHLTMTLTAPNCPVAEELPRQAQQAVANATGWPTTLGLTFDPPWKKENLSMEAKLALGLL